MKSGFHIYQYCEQHYIAEQYYAKIDPLTTFRNCKAGFLDILLNQDKDKFDKALINVYD